MRVKYPAKEHYTLTPAAARVKSGKLSRSTAQDTSQTVVNKLHLLVETKGNYLHEVLTGIIQLAMSPNCETCMAPRIVISMCPLRVGMKQNNRLSSLLFMVSTLLILAVCKT